MKLVCPETREVIERSACRHCLRYSSICSGPIELLYLRYFKLQRSAMIAFEDLLKEEEWAVKRNLMIRECDDALVRIDKHLKKAGEMKTWKRK